MVFLFLSCSETRVTTAGQLLQQLGDHHYLRASGAGNQLQPPLQISSSMMMTRTRRATVQGDPIYHSPFDTGNMHYFPYNTNDPPPSYASLSFDTPTPHKERLAATPGLEIRPPSVRPPSYRSIFLVQPVQI